MDGLDHLQRETGRAEEAREGGPGERERDGEEEEEKGEKRRDRETEGVRWNKTDKATEKERNQESRQRLRVKGTESV